jgi:ribosomal protein S18 acetylase RimI-like enzyme
MSEDIVTLSSLETERFGVVAARCSVATADHFEQALLFCRENQVALLVARCRAADYSAAHAIEVAGGRLGDTLVYYVRDLSTAVHSVEQTETQIRPFRPADGPAVVTVAADAFRGYVGHYHTDPRLNRDKADEAYADWAYRSCRSRTPGDEVFVADRGGAIVGFLSLRLNAPEEAEIVLNGVSPAAQGMGVYRHLLAASLVWSQSHGASRTIVSTQLTNFRVQRAWIRAGFQPANAQYTFHLWFR